jgi:hypothetical protein
MTSTIPDSASPNPESGSPTPTSQAASPAEGSVPRWTLTTTDGQTRSGPLGSWAQEDPSESDLPPEVLHTRLEDLTLWRAFDGTQLPVFSTAFKDSTTPVEYPVLSASLDCYPHEDDPAKRVPLLNIELAPECWIADLDPAALDAFLAAMREQLDVLEKAAGTALRAAREEWDRIREDREPDTSSAPPAKDPARPRP